MGQKASQKVQVLLVFAFFLVVFGLVICEPICARRSRSVSEIVVADFDECLRFVGGDGEGDVISGMFVDGDNAAADDLVV